MFDGYKAWRLALATGFTSQILISSAAEVIFEAGASGLGAENEEAFRRHRASSFLI
jgi:hypothetical protein